MVTETLKIKKTNLKSDKTNNSPKVFFYLPLIALIVLGIWAWSNYEQHYPGKQLAKEEYAILQERAQRLWDEYGTQWSNIESNAVDDLTVLQEALTKPETMLLPGRLQRLFALWQETEDAVTKELLRKLLCRFFSDIACTNPTYKSDLTVPTDGKKTLQDVLDVMPNKRHTRIRTLGYLQLKANEETKEFARAIIHEPSKVGLEDYVDNLSKLKDLGRERNLGVKTMISFRDALKELGRKDLIEKLCKSGAIWSVRREVFCK